MLIFHRPSRYTKVLYNVNRQYFINKKEMKMDQLADHDTSWKSDGMKWVFKSFVEAWDYFNEFGIEGRDIEPLFCYDNGSPAYYHLEKFEKDETSYIVKIGEKIPISKLPAVKLEIKKGEEILKKNGRVFVRYSGTENKLRIMVEGQDAKIISKIVKKIENSVKKEIGA